MLRKMRATSPFASLACASSNSPREVIVAATENGPGAPSMARRERIGTMPLFIIHGLSGWLPMSVFQIDTPSAAVAVSRRSRPSCARSSKRIENDPDARCDSGISGFGGIIDLSIGTNHGDVEPRG
jgi:hypothetical protein